MKHYDLSKITTYHAGAIQAYVNRKLQRICDAILSPYGITKMQWMVIGHIYDHQGKGVRVSDLAEKLGTNMSFLTNTINLLESRGILERTEDRNDSRAKLVEVSDSFKTRVGEIEEALRTGLRKTIYADIDPAEFSIYIKVLSKLAAVDESAAEDVALLASLTGKK